MSVFKSLYFVVKQNRPLIQNCPRINFLTEVPRLTIVQPLQGFSNRSADENVEMEEILSSIPDKPKRPPGPYIRFIKLVEPQIIEKNPNFTRKDIVKTASQMWKNADKETLLNIQSDYFKDIDNYNKQVESYQSSLTEIQRKALDELDVIQKKDKKTKKLKKKMKELGKPKRPPNPYLLFVQEQKSNQVIDGNLIEWTTTISNKWKSLPEEEKNKYIEKAKKLSEKYIEEKEEWENEMKKAGHTDLFPEEIKLSKKSGRSASKDKSKESKGSVTKDKSKTERSASENKSKKSERSTSENKLKKSERSTPKNKVTENMVSSSSAQNEHAKSEKKN